MPLPNPLCALPQPKHARPRIIHTQTAQAEAYREQLSRMRDGGMPPDALAVPHYEPPEQLLSSLFQLLPAWSSNHRGHVYSPVAAPSDVGGRAASAGPTGSATATMAGRGASSAPLASLAEAIRIFRHNPGNLRWMQHPVCSVLLFAAMLAFSVLLLRLVSWMAERNSTTPAGAQWAWGQGGAAGPP